jgi:hypothetical protein
VKVSVSAAAWREIRKDALAVVRLGIDAQRTIAGELDRRAGLATGKRREKLARIAATAREQADATEAELARVTASDAPGAFEVSQSSF